MKDPLTRLLDRIVSETTDEFLEMLLRAMSMAFTLSKSPLNPIGALDGYHEQIDDFQGRYLFQAVGGANTSAVFDRGQMEVLDDPVDDWDINVMFSDNKALRDFILSDDHDVMGAIFENRVQTEGNLNYIFKFAFMARDLLHRFNLDRFAR
ncbi:MAG: hypothetical protein HY912_14285 [Desulfomonile tiedjei]|uniref:SCP2 domain-containing protein n=1 Tax=Desulfomonile tiedjei TaxID=2358 RepID=A0A9D6V227_9BACT|nr:hypothetical protein [Desulfomonile tiedjei]